VGANSGDRRLDNMEDSHIHQCAQNDSDSAYRCAGLLYGSAHEPL
jgi:hypothetical protein